MGDPEARIERLRLLARLNQRISSSLDYDEALTAIARAASEIMAVPSVSVWVADAETSTVTVRVGHRSEEHTSELQSQSKIVCRLLLEKKKKEEMKYLDNPNVNNT